MALMTALVHDDDEALDSLAADSLEFADLTKIVRGLALLSHRLLGEAARWQGVSEEEMLQGVLPWLRARLDDS